MHCSQYNQPLNYTVASQQPLPWKGRNIYWHLNNTTHQLLKHEQLLLLDDVVKEINDLIYPLRMVSTQRRQDAYFQIYWVTGNKILNHRQQEWVKNPYNFTSNIMAVAYPRWGTNNDGMVLLNNDLSITKIKFRQMLLHEWLHGYGLGHTTEKGDIMNRSYNPNYRITSDTVKGIENLLAEEKRNAEIIINSKAGTPPALNNNQGCLAVLGKILK